MIGFYYSLFVICYLTQDMIGRDRSRKVKKEQDRAGAVNF